MTALPKPATLVLTELRLASSLLHRRLEQRIPFATADYPLYRQLIQAYYGFYCPLERLLAEPAMDIPGLDWSSRCKVPALRRDLLALGLDAAAIDALPECTELPPLTSAAHVLGVLYVLEGATLGGQMLRSLIEIKLGVHGTNGAEFLAVYNADTDALWRSFLQCLSQVRAPPQRANTVDAAQATFLLFEQWLQARDVLR